MKESSDGPGLTHSLRVERAVKQLPQTMAPPRHLSAAAVVGGGTMGVGIATALLRAGLNVTLVEATEDRAATAKTNVRHNLEGALKRGKMAKEQFTTALHSLRITNELDPLSEADIVIEAIYEDIKAKTELFCCLDKICNSDTILATNTSYLDVDLIASSTSRPWNVLGMHFFSPAHIMRLVEVVVAHETKEDVVSSAFSLATRMDKVPVRSGVCDGFIGNRIQFHCRKALDYMLMDGASFAQIDDALENFGFPLGPFATSDLAGLDIGWASRKRKAATRPPEERYVAVGDKLCERGWLGRKTGRGYYLYENGTRTPNPDAVLIVDAERAKSGSSTRQFTDDDIVARYMAALISESARVLEEKIADRPVDIEAVFQFGFGFPKNQGGPLHYADEVGLGVLLDRISTYALEDAFYWKTPALMEEMFARGMKFADLNDPDFN